MKYSSHENNKGVIVISSLGNRTKGVIYIIMSAFGFAIMSAFVKLAGDLPSFQKSFFRNIVAVLVALITIIRYRGKLFGSLENQKILLLRSTFGTLGILFNYYAIDRLVLSDANMLNKLSPFFVIIFSALFLSEKINFKQTISIIIAFVGAIFIIRPSMNFEVFPALVGLLGAISAAAAYTCVRAIGNKEQPYTIVFYFSFFSSVVLLPFVIIYYVPMSFIQLVYLLLAGVFASIGQFGVTLAYRYAPAKEISIFDYTNILFSALISIFVFGTFPDGFSFIGYIIIFAAALYMFIYNKKLDNKDNC